MARSRTTTLSGAIVSAALLAAVPIGTIQADGDDHKQRSFRIKLSSFQEVPALSSPAKGEFRLRISGDGTSLSYVLSYSDLSAAVTQAHIHLGQRHTNGGISVFLCGTASNPGPAGTPLCPASGTVERTVTAAEVIGPAGQGIAAGEFAELVTAIRAGATYANVHTTTFPGGEIRGQIK
jgi:hypothetical protein